MIYKVSDKFILRRPLLKKNVFLQTDKVDSEIHKQLLLDAIELPSVRESILIASHSLYKSLELLKTKQIEKKNTDVAASVNNYLTRLSTRATPFGLFGLTSYGTSAQTTNIELNPTIDGKKYVTPDMEWLLKIAKKLESDQNVLETLSLKWNPITFKHGNRLKLSYSSNWGVKDKINHRDNSLKSIKHSKVLETVIGAAKNLVSYNTLILKIKELDPSLEANQIHFFVNQLIENEFLLTNLRPTLIETDYLSQILTRIKKVPSQKKLYSDLTKIKESIKLYEESDIGKGIDIYTEIVKNMKSINKSKNYLKVDLVAIDEEVKLQKDIFNEIEDAVNFLMKITPFETDRFPYITQFLNLFIQEYGLHKEVPILELLDLDIGLGNPYSYEISNSKAAKDEKEFRSFILKKILEAIKDSKREINLSEEECDTLIDRRIDSQNRFLPAELEVFTKINNLYSNQDRTIEIIPNTGSEQIGKVVGRFNYILNEKNIEVNNNFDKNNVIYVELIELLRNGNLLNVGINDNPLKHQVHLGIIGSEEVVSVSLENIMVGIKTDNQNDSFYFRDQKSNKEIKFITGNNLNYNNDNIFSYISRFLIEVSIYKQMNPFYFSRIIDSFINLPYIPNIKYKNTILYPERWVLEKTNLENSATRQEKHIDIERRISELISKWNMPTQIKIIENDNQIPFNISNPAQKRIFIDMLLKEDKDFTTLSSQKFNDNSKNSPYNDEFVFLISKKDNIEKQSNFMMKQDSDLLDTKNIKRIFFLGDEWLYIKLYGINSRMLEFITIEISDFIDGLFEKNIITQFFYLIYEDPNKHIRIRFKVKDKKNINILLNMIYPWVENLLIKGLLKKIVYDSYIREVERYGGPQLIEFIENIFFADSLYTIDLLKENHKLSENDKIIAQLQSIVTFVVGLGIDYDKFTKIIVKNFTSYKKFREEYHIIKRHQRKYLFLMKDIFFNKNSFVEKYKKFNIILDQDDSLSIVNKKLSSDKLESIVFSLIHMHCNRMSINNNDELKIMYILRHTLSDMEYIMKNDIEPNTKNY